MLLLTICGSGMAAAVCVCGWHHQMSQFFCLFQEYLFLQALRCSKGMSAYVKHTPTYMCCPHWGNMPACPNLRRCRTNCRSGSRQHCRTHRAQPEGSRLTLLFNGSSHAVLGLSHRAGGGRAPTVQTCGRSCGQRSGRALMGGADWLNVKV